MRCKASIFGVVVAAAILPQHAPAAVSADNFLLNSTADLATLCSASASDPMSTAAVNFCHGFVIGVERTLREVDAAETPRRPMFCLPAAAPTRSAAVAEFVQWANADPSRAHLPATDGVASFLAAQFPCAAKQ